VDKVGQLAQEEQVVPEDRPVVPAAAAAPEVDITTPTTDRIIQLEVAVAPEFLEVRPATAILATVKRELQQLAALAPRYIFMLNTMVVVMVLVVMRQRNIGKVVTVVVSPLPDRQAVTTTAPAQLVLVTQEEQQDQQDKQEQ
jgi:hypothetical protein